MWLSDTSVRRPVLAVVVNLLIIAFGLVSFGKLPLREYPDIDPPVVSIDTNYRGASASVVETRVTELIEDRVAGVEGVKTISSSSSDGRSRITIEFDIDRNIDDAANDLRDRVSGILDNLPEEADPPEIEKSDSNDDVIMWLNLAGEGMSIMELSDYARRYLQDRFSALDGVARVRVGGGQEIAMRIWLDRDALAARNLTAEDVETALRSENVELPAGSIESSMRDFTVRMERSYQTIEEFKNLVIKRGADGYLVRLGDVADVEIGAVESRSTLRGNGVPMVGVGIIKQSQANTIEVARLAKEEMARVNKTLPANMALKQSYDTSVFIESSIEEVYKTLFIAVLLVVLVIYCFLGNFRAMLVPAVTVPVSLIGTFIILYAFGFTINLLTLLALVLAIGLVVDDAIVVIENIHRRIEMGEPRVVAAYRGTRQVGFAVIATTIVLVSVFMPITFLEGDLGRLFTEFAVTMSAAVLFSSFVALTFSPMLSSKILDRHGSHNRFTSWLDKKFEALRTGYIAFLKKAMKHPVMVVVLLLAVFGCAFTLFKLVPSEYAPKEDRGAFFLMLRGPEGTSYNYITQQLNEVERRLTPFVESGEFERLLMRAPRSFGAASSFNDGIGIVVLSHWDSGRKPIWYYVNKVRELTSDMPGIQVFPVVRQALGGGWKKPVQFVLGGPTYDELAQWRDIMLEKASENKNLIGLDHDYLETKPQIGLTIQRNRAGDLGVPVAVINRTLESMLGSRNVTTFIDRGEEYDVILESKKDLKQSPTDISNIYVRSQTTGQLIPLSNLVEIKEYADATSLNRYNRMRSITLEANLADGYSMGEALNYLEGLVRSELPPGVSIDYKGGSLDYIESGSSIFLIFLLALVVVYLVLAGQFESFVHPFIIMMTVPLAITGALFALWAMGLSLNIYSEIGLIILIGLAAKNGILIVEFINQLRDEGVEFTEAILEASGKRLRPILMTAITTAMGAVPLILSFGAGAETRFVIGIVIFAGVIIATAFTIVVIPVMYHLLAKNTTSPHAVSQRLEKLLKEHKHEV